MRRYVFTKKPATHYTIALSNLSTDLDLYSHWLPDVSRSDFQFSAWAYGNEDEQIDFDSTKAGKYYIGVYGYERGHGLLQLFASPTVTTAGTTDEVGWPVDWAHDGASKAQLIGGGLNWLELYDYQGSCGWTHHPGLDLNTPGDEGRDVVAVAAGTVTGSGYSPNGWGNVVTIEHSLSSGVRFESLYGHLGRRDVQLGTVVSKGETIGTVGRPPGGSPHLHFEIRRNTSFGTFDFPCQWSSTSVDEAYDDPGDFIRSH
jgi:murein DD-endopeptidase MepM/ murein hydrolase activator NlpD